MNPTDLVTPALVIGLGIGIMQALKYADTNNVFKRFYPIASFIIGIILAVLFHFTLLAAITTALAIAGVYDGWTYTVMGKGQSNPAPVVPSVADTTSTIKPPDQPAEISNP